jgi:hypothetical protein
MDVAGEVKKALVDLGIVVHRPAYATIEGWSLMTGMSRRSTYRALACGDLKAIKLGTRTLIDVEHGLAWLRSLPAAKIHAPSQRQSKAEAA